MNPSLPDNQHWPQVGSGLWTRWWGYLARWLLFGLVVSFYQPTEDQLDPDWLQRLCQALWGLLFGSVCAVVFTLAENTLNVTRAKWKTWALVTATWLVVKVVVVSTLALVG
jgi:hypothetical protein